MEEEKLEEEKFEDFEAYEHKKVCLVEDDDDIREIYSTKLKIGGYEVLEAVNGEEGLKVIKEKKPDLILLDIILPLKDGYEVLDELKKDEKTKDIPVILLTNLESQEDIVKAFEKGATTYLVKSDYKLQDVVKKIKMALGMN